MKTKNEVMSKCLVTRSCFTKCWYYTCICMRKTIRILFIFFSLRVLYLFYLFYNDNLTIAMPSAYVEMKVYNEQNEDYDNSWQISDDILHNIHNDAQTINSITNTTKKKELIYNLLRSALVASLNITEKFQSSLDSSIPPTLYTCRKNNFWADKFFQNIFPEYKFSDKLATVNRDLQSWYDELQYIESSEYDIFISNEEYHCNEASSTWLFRKFKGQYISTSGESIEIPIFDVNDPKKHVFGPTKHPKEGDLVLTYLQIEYCNKFRTILPASNMIDGSKRPRSNMTNFLVYAQSNCVNYRDDAFGKLSKIGNVHHSGKCNTNLKDRSNITEIPTDIGIGNWHENIHHYAGYRFCLTMEHTGDHPTYVSEKILLAFIAGCIPIYYGADLIFDIFNPKAFIFYDIKNPQPALDQIARMEANRHLYDAMMAEPILANGNYTIETYFSFTDDVGNGKLKRKMRAKLGLPY